MRLYELRELFIDESQLVRVYDATDDVELIYEGNFDMLPEELEDEEVSSLDNVYKDNDGYFGINIMR